MNTQDIQSLRNSFEGEQDEGNKKHTQKQTIFMYLQNNIATASMVTDVTGIPQKCITRYKRDLEQKGLLAEVKKGYCQKTKHLAWFLTTNQSLFPKSNQLNLFRNG